MRIYARSMIVSQNLPVGGSVGGGSGKDASLIHRRLFAVRGYAIGSICRSRIDARVPSRVIHVADILS
jgi:hypothetical protein